MKSNKCLLAVLIGAAASCTSALAQEAKVGPAPNEVIYLPQIPTVADLTKSATAHGLTIASIRQMNGEEVAVYRSPDGQARVVAYLLLSEASSAAAAVVVAPTPAGVGGTAAIAAPPLTSVVNYDAIAPGYYDYYADAYCPWGWYPGGFWGLGFGYGYGGGYGFRGHGYGGGGRFHGGGLRGGGGFHGRGGFHGGGGRR
jgi:uncharacterized membrane protein YgcG